MEAVSWLIVVLLATTITCFLALRVAFKVIDYYFSRKVKFLNEISSVDVSEAKKDRGKVSPFN